MTFDNCQRFDSKIDIDIRQRIIHLFSLLWDFNHAKWFQFAIVYIFVRIETIANTIRIISNEYFISCITECMIIYLCIEINYIQQHINIKMVLNLYIMNPNNNKNKKKNMQSKIRILKKFAVSQWLIAKVYNHQIP